MDDPQFLIGRDNVMPHPMANILSMELEVSTIGWWHMLDGPRSMWNVERSNSVQKPEE